MENSNQPIQKEKVQIEQETLELLKSEVNFLIYPFFFLSKRTPQDKIEYKAEIERNGKRLKILWKVTPHPEYGKLGIFDKKVFKAIEHLLTQMDLPIQNPISFSIYELCKKMGLEDFGGTEYGKVKDSLKRLTVTPIESQGTFYNKQEKRWINDVFHLYDRVLFKGDQLPNGVVAETNHLYLSSWYLENLNALYIRPVDYDYYKNLKSRIAQRLYELLGVKFYYIIKNKISCIRYKYSTLCQLLPLTRQKYNSYVERQLRPAHEELEKTEFISKVHRREIPGEKDWLISYFPGSRAKDEIERAKEKKKKSKDFNRVEQLPTPQTDDDALVKSLISSMLEALGDKENYPFYKKLALQCVNEPRLEDIIFRALSDTKDADRRKEIRTTKGAYFTDSVKRYAKKCGINLRLRSG